MPNHVHVPLAPLTDRVNRIIKSWKAYSARVINETTGNQGALWTRDYHDRYIRDEDHYLTAKTYIRNNPVKAGLCSKPEDWPFGSASREPPRTEN